MRILVAIQPLMYRETLVHTLSQRLPHAEILVLSPEEVDGEVGRSGADLVVCNRLTDEMRSSVFSWVRIAYEDSLNATFWLNGEESTIENISVDDMLRIAGEVERLTTEGRRAIQ